MDWWRGSIVATTDGSDNSNYAAARGPLNAARRSLKPMDGSFGAIVFAFFVVTCADSHNARAFPPTPIELSLGFRAERVALSGQQAAA